VAERVQSVCRQAAWPGNRRFDDLCARKTQDLQPAVQRLHRRRNGASAVFGDEVKAGEVLAHLGVLAGLEQRALEVADPASGKLQLFLLLLDQPTLLFDLPLSRPALVASEHENLTP
jgi:hypothetical protein